MKIALKPNISLKREDFILTLGGGLTEVWSRPPRCETCRRYVSAGRSRLQQPPGPEGTSWEDAPPIRR